MCADMCSRVRTSVTVGSRGNGEWSFSLHPKPHTPNPTPHPHRKMLSRTDVNDRSVLTEVATAISVDRGNRERDALLKPWSRNARTQTKTPNTQLGVSMNLAQFTLRLPSIGPIPTTLPRLLPWCWCGGRAFRARNSCESIEFVRHRRLLQRWDSR